VTDAKQAELAREQAYVDRLYGRLDRLRAQSRDQLREVRRRGASGTPQARSERDAFATMYEDRLARLDAAEAGLCFGRLDLVGGERHYIGRIGLLDDAQETLLVDWRAPAAEAFYRATPANPLGVVRRRHLRLRVRRVVDIDDDVFDLDTISADDRATLSGQAVLLAALSESRTGHMRDIVATIQAEQDQIIRADLGGVLVVQGGPGTGKTAVGLHRAAYLLYAHRERLERSGVLVVGPNRIFTRYIEAVLPSLGETGVVLATPDRIGPEVDVRADDGADVVALKSDLRMVDVIAAAVAARETVPAEPLVVPFDEHDLQVPPRVVADAVSRARRSRRPHNHARYTFARALLQHLVREVGRVTGDPELSRQRWVARTLMRSDEFRDAVNACWPRLTPAELVEGMYADPSSLEPLSVAERQLLRRPPGSAWTPADVPLLDEAAVLLGDPDEILQRAADRRREREERQYAAEVIAATGTRGRVSAEQLAQRYREAGGRQPLAERAGGAWLWEYGHVIVDEAQELTPMAWRMLFRRCPSRSMTVVGDIAQTSSSSGAQSWADALDPFVAGRWRAAELTVNYRTPAQIMAVAGDVLAATERGARIPRSVRETDDRPWVRRVERTALADTLVAAVRSEQAEVGEGTVAVLLPASVYAEVAETVTERLPDAARGPAALDARVAVLRVAEAKGLEFDSVLVVEPRLVVEGSPRGGHDLYVALTRATRRLGVLHASALPTGLERLTPLA
jgi:DNA helicase IV